MPAGERWRTTGACSGMPRPAWLSRPNGGTTSGLFSEVGSLAQTQHRPLRSSSLSRFPKKKKPDLKPAPSDDLTSTSDDSKSEVEDRRLPHERIADEEFSDADVSVDEYEEETPLVSASAMSCKVEETLPGFESLRAFAAFAGGA